MDAHEVLSVRRGASEHEIRRAYSLRARETHPETSSAGSMRAFRRVQDAYERLMERQADAGEVRRTTQRPVTSEGEVVEELSSGWLLRRDADGAYYVGDGRGAYIDADGSRLEAPVRFESPRGARTAHARHVKHERSGQFYDPESGEVEGEVEWGSTRVVEELDGFWRLIRRRPRSDGDSSWAVVCVDRGGYVTSDGRLSRRPAWHRTREHALDAHRLHRSRTPEVSRSGGLVLTLVYLPLLLPVKLAETAIGTVQRARGREPDVGVHWLAELLFVAVLVSVAVLLGSIRIAGLVALHLLVVVLYRYSPYEPEGPLWRPRWRRGRRPRFHLYKPW